MTVPSEPQDTTDIANRELRTLLRRLGACGEARDAVGDLDGRAAWEQSQRGDHLLWIAARLGVDRRMVARAAARCAETALEFVPEGEERPRRAVEAVLRWADDPTDANLEAVRVARSAYAAAYAAYAAAYAAYAAAWAAYAADWAADAAAWAADAAAWAADAADARRLGIRQEWLGKCAVIVRETIPFDVILVAYRGSAARRPTAPGAPS